MANVNFFSPDGGTTRYPIEDTEARSRIAGQQSLLKDTVGWTGKNKLNIPDQTLTSDGVTVSINNGVASFSGTNALSSALWIAGTGINIPKGTYIFNGLDTTQNIVSNLQLLQSDNTEIVTTSGKDSSKTVTIPNDLSNCKVHFRIVANGNTDGIKAYPMLRDASITDDTYEPYHESVEGEIEQIYADNGVLGAKNFLNPTYAGGTVNGVTITANENKTYELNGAPSSGNMAVAIYTGTFPVGRYILNGVPDFTTYGARLHIRETAGALQVDAIDTGKGIEFTIPSATTSYSVFMYLNSGYTANNLIIKPMLRLASDPDDTYQPYVMTNRELTEIVTQTEVVTLQRNTTNTTGADIKLFRYGKLRILTGFIAPTVKDTSQANEHPMLASNLSSDDTPQDFARGLLGRMGIIAGIVIVYADGKIQFTSSTTQNVYFNITWIAK